MSAQRPQRLQPAGSESGFTLLEVLVSLILLALVLVLLAGGMRYARGAWDATARLDELAGSDMAETFIRARLIEAMPLYEQRKAGVMQVLFQGASDSVSFVAPAPNGPGGAGLYRYTLETEPGAGGLRRTLIVKLAPYLVAGASDLGTAGAYDRHELVRNVRSVSFRYFGRGDLRAAPAWHAAWPRADAIPRLVEIGMARDDSDGGAINLVIELRLQTGMR